MRKEQLQAIKERFEKATPGPWRDSRIGIVNEQGHDVLWATISEEVGAHKYDLDFILNSIRDIPALVAEVERLQNIISSERRGILIKTYENIGTEDVEVQRLRQALESIQFQLFSIRGLDEVNDSEITGICAEIRRILDGE